MLLIGSHFSLKQVDVLIKLIYKHIRNTQSASRNVLIILNDEGLCRVFIEMGVYRVYRCLSFCPFSCCYCVVWPSLIYGFLLHRWYLQTLFADYKKTLVVLFVYIYTLTPSKHTVVCYSGFFGPKYLYHFTVQQESFH